ncbi:ABC transporter permease [Dyella sp.]|uniref:ABC transporter permease n=1 Tax=Dyella sp. TaxID=1869338 RepID=UPI002ED6A4BA
MNQTSNPVRRTRAFFTVYFKEVRENLRDRRTIMTALITGPLLAPLLFVMMLNIGLNRELDKAEKPLKVPVIGQQYAPHLFEALRAGGIVAGPPIANPEEAVRNQDADVVVRVTPDYPKSWRKGEPVQVEVIFDSSQRDASTAVERVSGLVDAYGHQQGAMRLVARGLSPSTAWPVNVARRDQATAQARGVLIFGLLPYFFVITMFMGGMYLAIDLTAGERERQSLEPLFANPVARWRIFAGKLAAICTFSAVSLLISLIAFSVVGHFLPIEKLGMELELGVRFCLTVLVMALPLIVLLAALQSMVAAFAKSYREAQTYLSLLMLVPALPSVLLMALPVKPQEWMYAVPLLSQHLGVMRVLRGDGVTMHQMLFCLGGSALAALVAVLVTAQLYRSERLAISS